MNSVLPKWLKRVLPSFIAGAIGALLVIKFQDHRVIVRDYSGPGEMKIIRVDGSPAEHRTRRFLVPTSPYTLVSPGKRSLTIEVVDPSQQDQRAEHTIEVEVYKGLEYRLGKGQDGSPTLVITKI
jgi:hypothetical protein